MTRGRRMTQITHRDEQSWRVFMALLGAGTFSLLIFLTPSSRFDATAFAMFVMTAAGLVYTSLSPHVWKYWWTAFFEILAVDLAVCAAWVYVEGVPGVPSMPPTLWPFFAFVLACVAGVFAVFSGFLRIIKTVGPGQKFGPVWGRMLWEGLLPYAMGGGALFVLGGNQIAATIFVLTLMTVLMLWAPGWKTSEVQTCCPA